MAVCSESGDDSRGDHQDFTSFQDFVHKRCLTRAHNLFLLWSVLSASPCQEVLQQNSQIMQHLPSPVPLRPFHTVRIVHPPVAADSVGRANRESAFIHTENNGLRQLGDK